jgi:hypothetical protein
MKRLFSRIKMRQPRVEAPIHAKYMTFIVKILSITPPGLYFKIMIGVSIFITVLNARFRELGLLINLKVLEYVKLKYRLFRILGLMEYYILVPDQIKIIQLELYSDIRSSDIIELVDWLRPIKLNERDSYIIDMLIQAFKNNSFTVYTNGTCIQNINNTHCKLLIKMLCKRLHIEDTIYIGNKVDAQTKLRLSLLLMLADFDGNNTPSPVPFSFRDPRVKSKNIIETLRLKERLGILLRVKDSMDLQTWQNLAWDKFNRQFKKKITRRAIMATVNDMELHHAIILPLLLQVLTIKQAFQVYYYLLTDGGSGMKLNEQVSKGRPSTYRLLDPIYGEEKVSHVNIVDVMWSFHSFYRMARMTQKKESAWEKLSNRVCHHICVRFSSHKLLLFDEYDRMTNINGYTIVTSFIQHGMFESKSRVTERDGGLIIRKAKVINLLILLSYVLILITTLASGLIWANELSRYNIDPTSLTSLIAVILALSLQLYVSVTSTSGSIATFFKMKTDRGTLTEKRLIEYGYTIPQFIEEIRTGNDVLINACSRLGACYLPSSSKGSIQVDLVVQIIDMALGGYKFVIVPGKGIHIVDSGDQKFDKQRGKILLYNKSARPITRSGLFHYHIHDRSIKLYGWHALAKVDLYSVVR